MSNQPVVPGDKLHIITRRLFVEDLRRHFAGEVLSAGDGLVEMHGYTYIFSSGSNEYQRRPQSRTRVFSLADANHIANKLRRDVVIESLQYRTVDGRLIVTDMKDLSLDINEFGVNA